MAWLVVLLVLVVPVILGIRDARRIVRCNCVPPPPPPEEQPEILWL